jgi:biofilm PGA synthesis N-glycosyltransferase PgaC
MAARFVGISEPHMKTGLSQQVTSDPTLDERRSLKYVLITPARNEAATIERTIQTVIEQTARPLRWVVVSDGSTDGTDDIVERYAVVHPWIQLVRMPVRKERHFAGKVNAFNAGRAQLSHLDYEVIGNLDADITMDEEYFAFLLKKFAQNPLLGVAGTPYREGQRQYDYRFTSIEHVSGACQMFRRECFEDIGGYVPIAIGGIDLVAVITARMKGWQTRAFPEKFCLHHRKVGTARRSGLAAAFKGGHGDYMLGMHPLWETVRCFYQMSKPPIVLGGSLRLVGFFWGVVTRVQKVVPDDLMRFRRAEQMQRLREFMGRVVTLKFSNPRAS